MDSEVKISADMEQKHEDQSDIQDSKRESVIANDNVNVHPSSNTNVSGRSRRNVIPRSRYGMVDYDMDVDYGTFVNGVGMNEHANVVMNNDEPTAYGEAIKCDNADQWKQAMNEEMSAMRRNGTWTLVKRTPDMNVLGSKWVYKLKRNSNGSIERFKARLVARGFAQIEGVDYEETYAPVMRYKSLRVLLSIANKMNYEIKQMDVVNAFLNAKLSDIVYMDQPPGFNNGQQNMVCELKKAVYGIKQAPNLWNSELDLFMKTNGFVSCKSDTCMYIRKCTNDNVIIVGIFVDDIVTAYHQDNVGEWIEFRTRLMNKYKIKDMGDIELILGMKIVRDRSKRTIMIDQSQYIKKILTRFNMVNSNSVTTPEAIGVKLSISMSPTSDHEKQQMEAIPYREAVGSLLYAAIATRPDISHAVNECAKFVSNPGQEHWTAVKRIMRYLSGTVNKGLCYSNSGTQNNYNDIVCVNAYADTDWAGDRDDRKSTGGYVVKLNGDAICWSSRKQRTIALSSAEAEYMAISSVAQEIKWIQQLLKELLMKSKTQIFTDNRAAQAIGKNDVYHDRTKHIDIRHHFIRDDVKNHIYEINWISSKYQLADIFTKALNQLQYAFLCDRILNSYV